MTFYTHLGEPFNWWNLSSSGTTCSAAKWFGECPQLGVWAQLIRTICHHREQSKRILFYGLCQSLQRQTTLIQLPKHNWKDSYAAWGRGIFYSQIDCFNHLINLIHFAWCWDLRAVQKCVVCLHNIEEKPCTEIRDLTPTPTSCVTLGQALKAQSPHP